MHIREARDVAEWQAIGSEVFVPLRCVAAGPRFHARVEHKTFGRGSFISRVQSDPLEVSRSPQAAKSYIGDDVLFTLQLSASSTVIQNGRLARLTSGQLAAYNPRQPYRLSMDRPRQEALILRVPRTDLDVSTSELEWAVARPILHSAPGVMTLFALATAFIDESGSLPSPIERSLEQLTGLILRTTLGISDPGETAEPVFAKGYARAHLSDPELDVETMAAAQHMSARNLHRVFAETGDTPAGWLRRERMILAERLLRETTKLVREIGASCGYPDASVFGRVYRRERGLSPSQTREASRAAV